MFRQVATEQWRVQDFPDGHQRAQTYYFGNIFPKTA